jgi:hypothetical protein
MANEIVCGPRLAFASSSACRSEPGPASAVVVTTSVEPWTAARAGDGATSEAAARTATRTDREDMGREFLCSQGALEESSR